METAQETGAYEAICMNLPFRASEDEIKGFFKDCGNIERINILRGHDGRAKGIAFIRFSDNEGLQAAIAKNGQELDGRALKVEKATPKEQRPQGSRPQRNEDTDATSIFVGNLSYTTTEDQLRGLFESCGAIKEIRVAIDQDGRARGFAHIDFESNDSVQKAIQKSGTEIDGRTLRVDYSSGKTQGGSRAEEAMVVAVEATVVAVVATVVAVAVAKVDSVAVVVAAVEDTVTDKPF